MLRIIALEHHVEITYFGPSIHNGRHLRAFCLLLGGQILQEVGCVPTTALTNFIGNYPGKSIYSELRAEVEFNLYVPHAETLKQHWRIIPGRKVTLLYLVEELIE